MTDKFKNIFNDVLIDRRFIHLKYNSLPEMYMFAMDEFFQDIKPQMIKERLCIKSK